MCQRWPFSVTLQTISQKFYHFPIDSDNCAFFMTRKTCLKHWLVQKDFIFQNHTFDTPEEEDKQVSPRSANYAELWKLMMSFVWHGIRENLGMSVR